MLPSVSILIPAYNAAAFIGDCLDSVLLQEGAELEIIVVDDGSTDGTIEIVERYICDNIYLIKQRNQGACKARNVAFEHSTGDYIQFLDADDLLAAGKLKAQLDQLAGRGTDVISSGTWAKFKQDPSEATNTKQLIDRDYADPRSLLIDMWNGKGMMQTAVWLTPRELIAKSGLWNESLSINQDGEFFARVLLNASSVHFAENSFVYYRVVPGSISNRSGSLRKAKDLLTSFLLYESAALKKENSDRMRSALTRNYYNYIYQYYGQAPEMIQVARQRLKLLKAKPPTGIGGPQFSRLSELFGFNGGLIIREFLRKCRIAK